MEFAQIVKTNLNIGYNEPDKEHFVYSEIGLRPIVFVGTYMQCLQVIGGVSLGISLEQSIADARSE